MFIKVFFGFFGYINFFDVFNFWVFVKEFVVGFNFFVVVFFKYVFFVGVVVGFFFDECVVKVFGVEDLKELFFFVCVYVRVWGVDRMFFFGDFIVFFYFVDIFIVKIIFWEVLDGVIVFGYEFEVFEIFSKKKGGKYCVF